MSLSAQNDEQKVLERIFLNNDIDACVEFFYKKDYRSDEDMKTFVRGWYEKSEKTRSSEKFCEMTGMKECWWHQDIFRTAMLCCGDLLNEKIADPRRMNDKVYEICIRRDEEWQKRWAKFLLKDARSNWLFIFQLFSDGIIERPDQADYYVGFISYYYRSDHETTKADIINDSLIRDHIWKLFEYDGVGDASLANSDCYGNHNWDEVFKELADENVLDRSRLLKCTLEALGRDFLQYRAGWYSRFHEFMEPTLEEMASFKEHYLHLCGSTIPPTVSFAVKALTKLCKEGLVEEKDLLSSLPPVLVQKSKGTVKSAIKLLSAALKKSKNKQDVLVTLCTALGHEAADIQKSVLDILIKEDAFTSSEVFDTVNSYADLISPSLKSLLPETLEASDEALSEVDFTELEDRYNTLKGKWPDELKLDEFYEASKKGHFIDLKINPQRLPLEADLPFIPVASIEEAIELCLQYIENPICGQDMERVIDAVSRFNCPKDESFAKNAAPLVKRCKKIIDNGTYSYTLMYYILVMIHKWAAGEEHTNKWGASDDIEGELLFWNRRLKGVIKKLDGKKPFSLLSIPTHDFFIKAEALDQRLEEYDEYSNFDFALALLRVSPGDPDFIPKNVILRHALGKGKLHSVESFVEHVADHVRAPAGFVQSITLERKYSGSETWVTADIHSKREADKGHKFLKSLTWGDANSTSDLFIKKLIMPNDGPYFFSCTAQYLSMFYSWAEGGFERVLQYDLLFKKHWHHSKEAEAMYGFGLLASERYIQDLFADLLIDGIAEGLIDSQFICNSLYNFTGSGLAICKRLMRSLKPVGDTGLLHKVIVRNAIERLLCLEHKEVPKDFYSILEIYQDILIQTGAELSDEKARNFLETIPGKGKASKLAKAILKLTKTAKYEVSQQEAAKLGLLVRIEKAESILGM